MKGEVPYSQLVRNFADLIHTILSHEKLPIYLHWRDQYLKYWLRDVLREEDHFHAKAIPELSALKADIYAEYFSWTKIPKQLNANLRHRQTMDSTATLHAEDLLLERLPSSILGQIVLAIRHRIRQQGLEEVDLGFDDEFVNENLVYGSIIEQVTESAGKEIAGIASWV